MLHYLTALMTLSKDATLSENIRICLLSKFVKEFTSIPEKAADNCVNELGDLLL
jgi:hypothetical protein